MLSKKALLGLLLTSSVAFGVYAACGDSVCGDKNGEWTCTAETPQGLVDCTASNPCTIRCP
ncbi:hypothetical protein [Thalassotalea fusca]